LGHPLPPAVKAVFAALGPRRVARSESPDFDAPAVFRPYADATWRATAAAWTRDALLARCGDLPVDYRAGQESEIPNFKGSFLGRFPLVLADFWTSDHLSERSRSVDAFLVTRARGTLTLKRR
jgi:hypothetical protein